MPHITPGEVGYILHKDDDSTETIYPPFEVIIEANKVPYQIDISTPYTTYKRMEYRLKPRPMGRFADTFLPPGFKQEVKPTKPEPAKHWTSLLSKPLQPNAYEIASSPFSVPAPYRHRKWMETFLGEAHEGKPAPTSKNGRVNDYTRLQRMCRNYPDFHKAIAKANPDWRIRFRT